MATVGGFRTAHYARLADHPEAGIAWGWDDIAKYLGRSVDTAQRWHRRHPMPLLRPGKQVCIPKSALDLYVLTTLRPAKGTVREERR